MEKVLRTYLLLKSWMGKTFTSFDIGLAGALCSSYLFGSAPTWLRMIANMTMEAPLPEAFVDFRLALAEGIRERFGKAGG